MTGRETKKSGRIESRWVTLRNLPVLGQTGLLIATRDSAALDGAISDLLQDPGKRQRFSSAAVEFARANIGLDEMLDRMETAFRRVIGGR